MWLIPLSFFAYQFVLRLWPGLMMQQIMEQFSIDASDFGLLAAFYYYGYAGMQIPVAILLDRFGARYMIFAFALLCGLSTLVFTYTNNFYFAVLSRFLIGSGSAAGFLGVSKVVSEWFAKEQYSKMLGFSLTFGLMGAIYGGNPVSVLVATYDWQNVALILSTVAVGIGVLSYCVLRSPDAKKKNMSGDTKEINNQGMSFAALFSSRAFSSPTIWFLAFANFLMVGSLEGFADVWGVPYLVTAYNLPKEDAAVLVSFIFVGMLVGGPLLGSLNKKIESYTLLMLCGLGMALAFLWLLTRSDYNKLEFSCLFFYLGIVCCYQLVVFIAGAKLVPSKDLGVTIAFLNCINMLGGSFFHTVIGKVMDLFWTGQLNSSGFKVYGIQAYQYAINIIPLCAIIGSGIIFGISVNMKRKYKKENRSAKSPEYILKSNV